jgi:L-alanine-DL-glutamate epimerase-like enolase superfamily enzyme
MVGPAVPTNTVVERPKGYPMEITEVEIHEFQYRIEDAAPRPDGEIVYVPGETLRPSGYVLTLRTDTGLEGHYRAHMWASVGVEQIQAVAGGFLIGRDPLERTPIWNDLRRQLRHTDHNALGAIDNALWDLAGKHYGESVSTLLGGRVRESVPAYASTMSGNPERDTPAVYADFAAECRELGYPAFKIHPHGDPDADIEICRAVAERVGDEMDLMLDPSSCYGSFEEAVRVGKVLDDLDFFWYEDPLRDTGDSIYAMRRLAAELETPILGIEQSRTEPFGAFNHLTEDALEMVRVDAHLGGGLTSAQKICHTVETAGMDVEPHVGGPEHLQLASTLRNAHYFEHGLLHPEVGMEWYNDQGYVGEVEAIDEDGCVPVPDGPGMGVEIDWAFVADNQTDHTLVDASSTTDSFP